MCVPAAEFSHSCLGLTGRSDLGVPAWLGQHQQPQRPAHGPADVPIRYTNTSTEEFLMHNMSFSTSCIVRMHLLYTGLKTFRQNCISHGPFFVQFSPLFKMCKQTNVFL